MSPHLSTKPQQPVNWNSTGCHTTHDRDDENLPLLHEPGKAHRWTRKRLRRRLDQTIDPENSDYLLLISYVITGLLDSSSILMWNSFVSMQTGNTVYLGLGLTDPYGGTRWIKAAVSVASFCFGSFMFARFHRIWGQRVRWVMILAHLMQMLLVAAAGTIAVLDKHSDVSLSDLRWQIVLSISLVAMSAAGQAVTSRVLELNALTSVVLTSTYCDLFSDAKLFSGLGGNRTRNQRVIAPLALILGVVAGGLWAKTGTGMAGALWTAVMLKLSVVIAWIFWRAADN